MKFFSRKPTPLKSERLKAGLTWGWVIFVFSVLYNPNNYLFSRLDVLLGPFMRDPQAMMQTENGIIGLSMELYKFWEKHGRFPSNQEGLGSLGILFYPLQDRVGDTLPDPISYPLDAWGQPYQYSFPALKNPPDYFDLFSLGEDGKTGTVDDVNNWDENKLWREYYNSPKRWWVEMLGDSSHDRLTSVLLVITLILIYYLR